MHYKRRIEQMTQEHENMKKEHAFMKRELIKMEEKLGEFPENARVLEGVRTFLQTLSEATRSEIMDGLEQITTLCVQSAFGEHFTFRIDTAPIRNSIGVEFYLINHHFAPPLEIKPNDNLAGGEVDVISIGLRFGLLKVVDERLIPIGPIVLDEPAKMVDGQRIERIGNLLEQLAEIFGRQIIMVTHHAPLMDILDKTILVRNENGRSIVE